MSLRRSVLVALLPLLGCASRLTAGAPSPHALASASSGALTAPTRQLDADTPMKTASGATFEAPKGWYVTSRDGLLVLEGPEHDLSLTLVETKGAVDAAKAIGDAWQKAKPGFAHAVKQTTKPPAKDGWDEITQTVYDVGATPRTVLAIAQRKGTTHYVALVDGDNAALDRRGAQLMTVLSTFKGAGVTEESFQGKTAHVLDAARLEKLEAFAREAAARTVPGAAIAIVQGGKLVYEKGFGVRELGSSAAVSPNTLFLIGSTTKSLTTLMMAKLVDERKFNWDTKVTDVLPSFALGDPEVTKKVQMKHTVCACAGLPRQDLEFFFDWAGASAEQRVSSMKGMKPTTGFGETFQYSNTMVATGGYVAAHSVHGQKALGPAYDEVMQSRVFGPLGMKQTTFDFAVARAKEHASPHVHDLDLAYGSIPIADEEGVISVRPAGAAWSNVRDMARYVQMELAHGKNESGQQVFSENNLLARREPQIKITDKMSYGLGLFVELDHGVKVVHHGGNNLGFTSDMFFLPDHDVGVVLLTNGSGSANVLRRTIRRRVLELLFDGNAEAQRSLDFGLAREKDAAAKELATIEKNADPAWLRTFIGTYSNASLGKIVLRFEGKRTVLDAGEWKSALGKQTSKDGTAQLVLLDRPFAGLTLLPGKSGDPTLTIEMPQQKYVFERAR